MIDLPRSTVFDKRIPKQKFYEKCEISAPLKRSFVEEIKEIRWTNKISPDTMNIGAGERVLEIEVFRITLASDALDEAVLRLIDKAIPYHTLFILSCDGKNQAWISYKEESESGALKVNRFFHTAWRPEEERPLKVDGLTMDAVYESLVRQIAGDEISRGETLKDDIAQSEARQKLEKEIARLEKQARAEKQPKKKFELVERIRELRR